MTEQEARAALQVATVLGVTSSDKGVTASLDLLGLAKAVAAAAATWHGAIQTDQAAAEQMKPLVATVKQVLLAAYSTQLDVLGDFGLTPRKKPVVSPATRTAAALKAKATREARGTKGSVQKAAITAPVTITPATATPVKSVAVVPAATPATGAPAPATTAPATASPAPASPPAPPTHS